MAYTKSLCVLWHADFNKSITLELLENAPYKRRIDT